MNSDSEQPNVSEAPPAQPAKPDEPSPPQGAAAAAPETPAASERIRIGSQRAGVERPVAKEPPAQPKPAATAAPKSPPPPPREKVELPNLRSGLTPDLEMELAAALGDAALDDLMASSATGPADAELEPDTRLAGRVIKIHRDLVFVDLGGRRQGTLSLRVFPDQLPDVGAELQIAVVRFQADDGLYELSLPGAAASVGDWSDVAEGIVVEARITGHNKGGLECEVNHLRGFIPAGQISTYRVEDFAQFVGQKLACVITEANPERRNLVLSHRAVMERDSAAAKEKLMAELQVGQTREGIVRSLQPFGAFVDMGGVDGLIHISQLSWERLKHASEALELGQKVKVRIQKIDPETGKISLGFRDLLENPWDRAAMKYPPRSHVTGTVSKLMDFGAFVRLEAGIEGLIHISELAHRRVIRPGDIVQEGQQVDALVLSVDPDAQRISLSLKAIAPMEPHPAKTAAEADEPDEPETPAVAPTKRKTPLKGGIGRDAGGGQFGLKW